MNGDDMTVEYFDDPGMVHMIGALCIPAKRLTEHVEFMGKQLCKIRKLDAVEVRVYDFEGNLTDQMTVYR